MMGRMKLPACPLCRSCSMTAPTLVQTEFAIEGMTCASCVKRVEKALSAVAGVGSASVNLATEGARVDHEPDADPQALVDAVARVGRPEERRVGKECGRTCRSRWSPCH